MPGERRVRVAAAAAAVVALAVAALAGSGCGKTVIDTAKVEAALEENLRGALRKPVASVECPSGVEVKAGNTFECTVNLSDGRTETATLRVRNKDADVEVTGLGPKK